jgi:hypothetical protein
MKLERFHFAAVLIAAVMLQGSGLAAQAGPVVKPATSQSGEKSADQQKDVVRNATDQSPQKEADENRQLSADVMRTISKRPPSARHSKPVLNHQPRPAKTLATKGGRSDAPAGVTALEQAGSKAIPSVANKAVSHRPSAPPSAVFLDGQQFKNSRDPGAHLAVTGGRRTSPSDTAVINGTNLKPRP